MGYTDSLPEYSGTVVARWLEQGHALDMLNCCPVADV